MPDIALETLSRIYTEFGAFCRTRGKTSEADTRSKIIDRILKEVLGWKENDFAREENAGTGYIDYLFTASGRKLFVIEAKKAGISFEIPVTTSSKRKWKIKGSLSKSVDIRGAIEQAQRYCVDIATRYAVVTNGYSWLFFRAMREDIPWGEGEILLFAGPKEIKDNFIEFWNLISKTAVINGSLDKTFSMDLIEPRQLYRPSQYLKNPDAPLLRNRFHADLNPFIEAVFRDLGDRQIKLLKDCYVYNRSLRIVDKDLRFVITDAIPKFLELEGVKDVVTGELHAGVFSSDFEEIVHNNKGIILLLLGGIGAGKTTFIKRFIKYIGKDYLEEKTISCYINFLTAPTNTDDLSKYLYGTILDQFRDKFDELGIENRETIKEAYSDKISVFQRMVTSENGDLESKITSWIEKWLEDIPEYVPRLIKTVSKKLNKVPTIWVDNVDQLPPDYQANIFLLAQHVASALNGVVVVALREESYYAASIKRTFTAYNNWKFHIASPPFTLLIDKRIKYCQKILEMPDDQIVLTIGTGIEFDKTEVSKFLNIIQESIFSKNRNIARFIESLSFGNMREALDMFATFIYSGATNVGKMLTIYDRQKHYSVGFHEFAKSVILGDRKFYNDSQSKIMNIFDCGQDRNSSHFTGIRILKLLLIHVEETSPEGRGYVPIEKVYSAFLDVFDNEQDLYKTLNRLVRRQLIQVDTRSTDNINGAYYLKISSAGWYYYKYLVRSFAYLDLIFHDTPVTSKDLALKLKDLIVQVEDCPQTALYMEERNDLRFQRVEAFLEYLKSEEEKELIQFDLNNVTGIFSEKIIDSITTQYNKEKDWIRDRVAAKRYAATDDFSDYDSSIPEIEISPLEECVSTADEDSDEIPLDIMECDKDTAILEKT